jgi:integrase/recombinase XerD
MYTEEVIIKILSKAVVSQPDIDTQMLKVVLEEVLYDYTIQPQEKALVVLNDVRDKVLLYLACRKLDGLSFRTLSGYQQQFRKFVDFMQKNVADITAMDIRMYLAAYGKTGVQDTTIQRTITILRGFFGWLLKNDYIEKDPMIKINSIKTKKRLREALDAEQLEMLRDSCKTLRERALLEFFFTTGCRLDEVVQTDLENINWTDMSLHVIGKGNKERIVYISAKAKLYLKKYLASRKDESEALFVTERAPHGRMGRRSIEREFKKMGKRVKINLYPHLIRHTTATMMLNGGAKLEEVQSYLGHEDPSTTLVYAKLSTDSVRNAHKKCIA